MSGCVPSPPSTFSPDEHAVHSDSHYPRTRLFQQDGRNNTGGIQQPGGGETAGPWRTDDTSVDKSTLGLLLQLDHGHTRDVVYHWAVAPYLPDGDGAFGSE